MSRIKLVLLIFVLSSVNCFPQKKIAESENSSNAFDQRLKKFLNLDVDPCDDFYQFACGNWNQVHPIMPQDYEARTFSVVKKTVYKNIQNLLETDADNEISGEFRKVITKEHSVESKIKGLYLACMENVRNTENDRILKDMIRQLGGWPVLEHASWNSSQFNFVNVVSEILTYTKDVLFKIGIFPNNDLNNILRIEDPVLGLPSHKYYDNSTGDYDDILNAYKNYMVTVMILMGAENSTAIEAADELFEFESKLADLFSNEEYNTTSLLEWTESNDTMKINFVNIVAKILGEKYQPTIRIYYQEEFLGNFTELLENTEPRIIANYMFLQFVIRNINYLGDKYNEAYLNFYTTINGVKALKPQADFCIDIISSKMFFAIGSMYLKSYFNNDTIIEINGLIDSLKDSYINVLEADIEKYNETLQELSEYFHEMETEIGYPNSFDLEALAEHDFRDLEIDTRNFLTSMLDLEKHLVKIHISILGKAIQDTVWYFGIIPFEVEAWYVMLLNRVIIPAGVLQSPFYLPENRAFNYASIGMMIGHELGHALERFVTSADDTKKCLVDQYNAYKFDEINQPVDGEKTFSENLADNIGLQIAYFAFQKLSNNTDESDVTENEIPADDRFTDNQKFFIHFAQSWCSNKRPEAVRNMLMSNVHTPNVYRVIGTLKNFDEFSKAFQCPVDANMNPNNKCTFI